MNPPPHPTPQSATIHNQQMTNCYKMFIFYVSPQIYLFLIIFFILSCIPEVCWLCLLDYLTKLIDIL